jgi:ACS family hexuronate transporter-like MFS transporter
MGLALSLIVWSVCGIANAFVGRLVAMHVFIRSAFAVGEAGNFPASIKTVAEWFPKRERALATGIFNSGSNFGAMIAALFVPWCMIYFGDQRGWKMAFIITGAAGFLWLIFWFWLYETPARQNKNAVSKAEFDYIHIDEEVQASAARQPMGTRPKKFPGETLQLPPDLVLLLRQIHDRWHLVVLPVLAAGLFEKAVWHDQARRSCCRRSSSMASPSSAAFTAAAFP